MPNNNMESYKKKTLDVLKYLIPFFSKHNIDWFIACGSAIGAVRHKGMIPWDDDIDLYMTRDNYNRLFALRDEMLKDGFRFITYDDAGYPNAFGKVMDNNTTVIETYRYPFNIGCNVDIFPLDLTSMGMMSFGNKWQAFRSVYSHYRCKVSRASLSGFKESPVDMLRVIGGKMVLLMQSRKKIIAKMREMEQSWNKPSGDRYVSFTEAGMYMFPKEWFDDYVMMPFEDIEVRVPKHYDEYLTYIYSDYMTPPPVEERRGEGPHSKVYVNLDENKMPFII